MNKFSRSDLCHKFTLINPIEIRNDPIYKLIISNNEIKALYKNNKNRNKKFLYFNKDQIHYILYESEEVFTIDDDLNDIFPNSNISELFYFELLLLDNLETINYIYSIEFIRAINKKAINNNFIPIKKILLLRDADVFFDSKISPPSDLQTSAL